MEKLSNTLYAKYVLERENAQILENDVGFIKYVITGKECFLADMFIESTKRSTSLCRNMFAELSKIASDARCEVITANIHLNDKGHVKTLQAAFKLGFKIARAQNDILLIIKELKSEGK